MKKSKLDTRTQRRDRRRILSRDELARIAGGGWTGDYGDGTPPPPPPPPPPPSN